MWSANSINGVVTTCLTIVGSAIALGGLILVSQSNLRTALGEQIALNREQIALNREEIAEVRRDLGDLNIRVARIEGSLLAANAEPSATGDDPRSP